jgi:hypothetical protein
VNWPVWSEDCREVKEEGKEVREWSGFEDDGYFVATVCFCFAGRCCWWGVGFMEDCIRILDELTLRDTDRKTPLAVQRREA